MEKQITSPVESFTVKDLFEFGTILSINVPAGLCVVMGESELMLFQRKVLSGIDGLLSEVYTKKHFITIPEIKSLNFNDAVEAGKLWITAFLKTPY